MLANIIISQSSFSLPPLNEIPDESDDVPKPGRSLSKTGPLELPAIIFGAAAFSNQYNDNTVLNSTVPVRTVRLALRYGIRAFDTSIYYGPSELVLGTALKALEDEFPRSSYQLMTKCGRYGTSSFDYSPANIRDSVILSLKRLQTEYLDTVYLHDIEFIATPVSPRSAGKHATALQEEQEQYGLSKGDEGKIRGGGDQKILDAFAQLRELQEQGLIKNIGITGYPLPTLLRIALLIRHNPPFKPVDVVLSYSHLNLQNATLSAFAPHFRERAHVKQLITASPLSMGLLTSTPPPWHPASKELLAAVNEVAKSWSGDLPSLAIGYAIRMSSPAAAGEPIPCVGGFSNPREVHESVRAWREIQDGVDEEKRIEGEKAAREIFERSGFLDWSWASPA